MHLKLLATIYFILTVTSTLYAETSSLQSEEVLNLNIKKVPENITTDKRQLNTNPEEKFSDLTLREIYKNFTNSDSKYNHAFRGRRHCVEFGLASSYQPYAVNNYTGQMVNSNAGVWNVYGRYSIPQQLFIQGRTSIELGSILGYFGGSNINQVYASLTHEFIFSLKYFYTTIGGGFAYRNIRGGFGDDHNTYDGINSRLVFHVRIGIGVDVTERINLEFFFKHFSNGHLNNPNRGYNFLGISLGYLI